MAKLQAKPWLPGAAASSITFINASLVDVEAGLIRENATVRTSNGFITAVQNPSNSSANHTEEDLPKSQVVDLNHQYILPGLIDCHVHMTATPGGLTLKELFTASPNTLAFRSTLVARQMLLRGFTSARDTGGADAALRDAIAEGLLPGPRLFVAGKALSQTGGHGDFRANYEGDEHKCCGGHQPSLGRVCDGVPQCLAAVRDELRRGANFIKIMCGGGVASPADPLEMVQFTAEEIRAITTTAGYLNTYVTAHAYTDKAIRHAVDNGVKGIEHGNFISRETAKYCSERGIVFTPTLVTYHAMTQKPFDTFLSAEGQAKNKQVLASGLDSLKILKEAGITMCYGSDLLSGLHVRQNGEFALRANVLTPAEILRSATLNAAKLVGMENKLGCLKVGAIADFLVVNENPLEDITALDRIEQTLVAIGKEGRVVASVIPGLEVDPLYRLLELEVSKTNTGDTASKSS